MPLQVEEERDNRLKLVGMRSTFAHKASDLTVIARSQLRTCEDMAKRLSAFKPKTAQEFEKSESMKDFVIKTAKMNEEVLELLVFVKSLLESIANDEHVLESAKAANTIRDQSSTIESLIQQRDEYAKMYAEAIRETKKHS